MGLKTTILAAVVAFAAAAIATRIDLRGDSTPPPAAAAKSAGAPAKASYAALLTNIDERIDSLRATADRRPNDWLIRMHLGAALFERASLTHQPGDFDRVQPALDESFALVPAGAGPLLLAARYNFSLHRLAEAEKFLDTLEHQAIPMRDDQLAAKILRGEIAAQRGQYDVALQHLSSVADAVPSAAKPELALLHAKTGDPAKAEALLTEALTATPTKDTRRRAWISLQLGALAMNRGELRAALDHLRAADHELSGWWLVQEHIAEIHSRRDEHREAIAIYEQLVGAAELPQHLDALAALYKHTGERQKSDAMIARAAARWDELLAHHPESALGHGLQHHLQFGAPERALELALANVALRPGGDAQVALARAYLKAGQPAEALAVAERVLATPYRTAAVHDVAAKAHLALGDKAAAEDQISRCYAINPLYKSDDHAH